MKKLVVVINGFPRSGKDTLVRDLHKRFMNEEMIYVGNFSSVAIVKKAAEMFGYTEEKKEMEPEKWRPFLSDFKDILDKHLNACMNSVHDEIESMGQSDILFVHCREPQNIMELAEHYFASNEVEVLSLLVHRDAVRDITENKQCHADKLVEEYPYDLHFYNPVDSEISEKSVSLYNKNLNTFYETLKSIHTTLQHEKHAEV